MTYKDKYMTTKSWRKKVFIMGMYARLMKYKGHDTSIRALAKYFDCAVGTVSENLVLAKPDNYKAHKGIKTRREAMKYCRALKKL